MIACQCSDLGMVVKVKDHPYIEALKELEIGRWVRLVECSACSQLWAVAEWDRYVTQLATKIPTLKRDSWQEYNVKAEKEFLIQSRGGLTDELCIWARCGKPRVAGVALCVDHLYATGAKV